MPDAAMTKTGTNGRSGREGRRRHSRHADGPGGAVGGVRPAAPGFLARRVPPGVEADDLLQDVFVRVIRHAGSLRSADRPEAWLFQIARNACGTRCAPAFAGTAGMMLSRVTTTCRPSPIRRRIRAAEAELAPCLTAMIGHLPEPYRAAIALTTLQGVSQADAARQLGLSNSGMKSRVQRGRGRLREMLVRCCAVAIDVRGGVSDFHAREVGACGRSPSSGERSSTGPSACSGPACTSEAAPPSASDRRDGRLQR